MRTNGCPGLLRAAVWSLLAAFAGGARAQDLGIGAGATRSNAPRDTSYGWLVSYSHDLSEALSASVSYQNEGHVPGHHRDGHSAQLWARTGLLAPQLTLAAGVGPYHYFDTTVAESAAAGFADAHGWGVMYSLSATWRARSSPWFYRAQLNRIEARNDLDDTVLLLGMGYRLDQDASFARTAVTGWTERRDEVALGGGQTIVNSFESQSALAKSVEYRYAFTPVVRGAIGWVSEGDARLVRRNGIVAQAWFEPSFYSDRFTIGLGYGGYFAVDRYRQAGREAHGVLSTTFSYHLARGWLARVTWHRIVSNYDRDSDIILLGGGYRF